MKIRCDNCGHKNPQDAQLCEECGAPLNRKKRPIVKLIVLFLALLLVDTALWFYFAHKPTQVRITVTSQNPEFGVVKGDSTYCQSDTITIVAIAKEGYRFVKWNDGNTDSVRTIVADGDKEYIAIFEACVGSGSEPVHETPDEEPVPPVTPPSVTPPSITPPSVTPPEVSPEEKPGNCVIQYSFGRYEGNCKDGIPEGEGTMYYTCRVQIAKHDTDNPAHYAEAGDRFVGSWGNGDIVLGVLYGKDGNTKEKIIAPKRFNPYDLNRDKCAQ